MAKPTYSMAAIKQQMLVAHTELLALADMLQDYPVKQQEAYGAAGVLANWISGINSARTDDDMRSIEERR